MNVNIANERQPSPAERQWTEEQLEAIQSRQTPIIVSAAAGSGKTSVLVERLLRIISDTENKTPADRIIVVTFTNDAAAQMKQRLAAALSESLEKKSDDWICRQQALLPAAKISTIHSFCFDLLRENIEELYVSDGFRILAEAENDVLISEALDCVFERLYTEEPMLMETLCGFFINPAGDDDLLRKNVLCLYEFLQSVPFYEDWLEWCLSNQNKELLAREYLKAEAEGLGRCFHYAESARRLCEEIYSPDINKNVKAYDILQNEAAFFWNAKESSGMSETLIFERFPNKDKDHAELWEKITSLRKTYKAIYTTLQSTSFSPADIEDDTKKVNEILSGMTRIISMLDEELADTKARLNALSFSDAEQLTARLLAYKNADGELVRTPLAKELSEYYKVVMVDEFQDSNNAQEMIFRLLSDGNFFAVGDVKQSIYRFRLANPRLFLRALDNPDYTKITLNENFRSSKEAIDFVNFTFGLLMSRAVGEVDYGAGEALVQGKKYPEADRAVEILRIRPCQAKGEGEQEGGSGDNEDIDENQEEAITQSDIAEALGVAKKISSMLGREMVSDGEALRRCAPRDFCILTRGNAAHKAYTDALSLYGIKSTGAEPEGYLKAREINILLSLLAVIDNPLLDLPLVTVLRSPMFLLSDNDLARLRMMSAERTEPLYLAVVAACSDGGNDTLFTKLSSFVKTLSLLKVRAASQSLDRLIRTIYDSTDFLSAVSVQKDGERKKANLRLLLEYAKSYEESSAGGLSGFLRYLSSMSAKGGDLALASSSEAQNAVAVKTIHKSKGLEYPFVFLCGTSKRFNLTDTKLSICFSLDYGAGFIIQNGKTLQAYDSFHRAMIRRINRAELISEELRLLYVAMTRAKERLFISINEDEKTRELSDSVMSAIEVFGGVTEEVTANAKSMLEWILAVLSQGAPAREVRLDCSVEELAEKEERAARFDPGQVEALLKRFDCEYDKTLANTAAKLTITEIAKLESDLSRPLERPFFASGIKGLKPTEIGAATHTFMQYADFTKAELNAQAEAERLADNGILTQAETEALNYGKIKEFFNSNIYTRIKNSEKIYREEKFLVDLSEISLDEKPDLLYNNGMLQGIADCFFKESDGFVLIDYKTDRANAQILTARYERQLKLYGAAIEHIYGIRIKETYIYSFELGKSIPIERNTCSQEVFSCLKSAGA